MCAVPSNGTLPRHSQRNDILMDKPGNYLITKTFKPVFGFDGESFLVFILQPFFASLRHHGLNNLNAIDTNFSGFDSKTLNCYFLETEYARKIW